MSWYKLENRFGTLIPGNLERSAPWHRAKCVTFWHNHEYRLLSSNAGHDKRFAVLRLKWQI